MQDAILYPLNNSKEHSVKLLRSLARTIHPLTRKEPSNNGITFPRWFNNEPGGWMLDLKL